MALFKRHLLIVDDDLAILEGLRLTLADAYTISCASSGQEARSLLESERIDLAILDVFLDDVSGLDLLEEIKRRWRIPVLVITGSVSDGVLAGARRAQADDYLLKPFDLTELRRRLHRLASPSAPV